MYVINPPGSNSSVLPVVALLQITSDGKENISNAVGYTMIKIDRLVSVDTTVTSTAAPTKAPVETLKWIVIGVCSGLAVCLVVIIVLVIYFK